MHGLSLTACLVAGLSALTTAAENDTFGLLEMDLVFPRNEATYAPFSESHMPVIFAFQNFNETLSLANAFRPRLNYTIGDQNNKSNIVEKAEFDLWGYVVSSYRPNKLWNEYHPIASTEGTWKLDWSVHWQTCGSGGVLEVFMSTQSISFSTKSSAGKLDLVAATKNDTTCPEGMGVAWDITAMDGARGEKCAEMKSPRPKATPCKIQLVAEEAERIASKAPTNTTAPMPTPDVKGAAQILSVGRAACLLAFVGVFHSGLGMSNFPV